MKRSDYYKEQIVNIVKRLTNTDLLELIYRTVKAFAEREP